MTKTKAVLTTGSLVIMLASQVETCQAIFYLKRLTSKRSSLTCVRLIRQMTLSRLKMALVVP